MTEPDRTIDGGPDGVLYAFLSARPWAPRTWGVAHKLWLSFGLVILLSIVGGLVSYSYVKQIDRDLRQVVAVEEPLEEAVLEMEINAGEGARAVLDYIRNLAPEHIAAIRDVEADYARFAADFERLAETDEERRLGQEVAGLYGEFKALGDEIVALADRLHSTLQTFRQSVEEIDEILDERLKPSAGGNTPEAKKKRKAVVALNELLNETFPAIEAYIVHRDPALRKGFMDTATNFERTLTLYRKTGLSAEEKGWLDKIDGKFTVTVTAGNRIMTVMDMLRERLARFGRNLETMDAILDDEIQPLIHAATVAAADDAKAATDRTALFLIFLGLVGLGIASTAVWAISRTILGPIRALVRGTEIVGGGDLEHRIDTGSGDEFGHLAAAFNRMVENLGSALRSVQDRTRDVEEMNETLKSEITERKQADAALIEGEQRFKDFAEAASDWFWEMDADLRWTYISERFFETFHVRPEAVIGKTRKELAGVVQVAADPEKWQRHFDDLEAHRPIRNFEYAVTGEDGMSRHITLSGVPVFNDAKNFRGYRGSATDITERKQAEESHAKIEQQLIQSQKMDAIGQLTGGIAHDFNNLLMVIDGFSRRAIRSIDDAQVTKECLERVISASDKAAKLTKQLLVFSRRQVLETRVVSPARVLEETVELLQRSVGEQFELALDISDDAIRVETDAGQLGQAVMNLVINARDAMPRGGQIVIGVRTAELDEDFAARRPGLAAGSYAQIYVVDQGSGMDPDTLEHIFEPFFTTKAPGKGTGLGLAMIYGFAQQSGGIVDVSSSPDAGSTFRIYLPLTDRAPEAEVSQIEAEHRGRGEAILLVEDDEDLLDLASSMLEELGYTVLRAEDGLAAIEIEEDYERPIDLLLSDVVMPNLDGFELATILGETRPDMKVVFMSGYPGHESLQNLAFRTTPRSCRNRSSRRCWPEPFARFWIPTIYVWLARPYLEGTRDMTQSNITLEDLKILVVDDSLDTLSLIMGMLKDLGINQIFTAKDGKEALEFLGADDDGDLVNLILCDWNMPRMTGIELLSQVRTVDPTMPFVMITGSADMQSVREAKSHGVNGYIKNLSRRGSWRKNYRP